VLVVEVEISGIIVLIRMFITIAMIFQQIENCTSIVLVDLVVLGAKVLLSTLSSKTTCRSFETLNNTTGRVPSRRIGFSIDVGYILLIHIIVL
jgi:hypothetical protein